MKLNMGKADRIIRAVIGIALLVAAALLKNRMSTALFIIFIVAGAILALTALIGFCPAYTPFKINTKQKKEI